MQEPIGHWPGEASHSSGDLQLKIQRYKSFTKRKRKSPKKKESNVEYGNRIWPARIMEIRTKNNVAGN